MADSWFGTAVMVASCWICGVFFLAFGLYARRREKPVWFWSGSTVEPDTIVDIPAYNRANGRMWIIYSLPFWVCGLVSFRWTGAAAVILTVACVGGIPALVVAYNKIFNKYKRNDYE